MPTNRIFRRRNWHRAARYGRATTRVRYPETVQQLIDGEPIRESEEARSRMIEVYYLHRYDELGEEIVERAGRILAKWRDKRSA